MYESTLWPSFRFLELWESCRQNRSERRFAELLSRLRRGNAALTAADWQLLESRVCGSAGHECSAAACERFEDRVELRPPSGSRKRRRRTSQNEDDEPQVEVTSCLHCPILEGATVIAARREKVNELNERHVDEVRRQGTTVHCLEAEDRRSGKGSLISDDALRSLIDKRARGQLQNLHVYEGMSALLTFNQDMATEFVNGTLGRIVGIVTDGDSGVTALHFKPEGSSDAQPPLVITRRLMHVNLHGAGSATRYQFPLVPACACSHLPPSSLP